MRRTDLEKWEGMTQKKQKNRKSDSKNGKDWLRKVEMIDLKSEKDWLKKCEGQTLNREDPIQKHGPFDMACLTCWHFITTIVL